MSVEGIRVVRGPDWNYGNKDGGEGHVGTVTQDNEDDTVEVRSAHQIINYTVRPPPPPTPLPSPPPCPPKYYVHATCLSQFVLLINSKKIKATFRISMVVLLSRARKIHNIERLILIFPAKI